MNIESNVMRYACVWHTLNKLHQCEKKILHFDVEWSRTHSCSIAFCFLIKLVFFPMLLGFLWLFLLIGSCVCCDFGVLCIFIAAVWLFLSSSSQADRINIKKKSGVVDFTVCIYTQTSKRFSFEKSTCENEKKEKRSSMGKKRDLVNRRQCRCAKTLIPRNGEKKLHEK